MHTTSFNKGGITLRSRMNPVWQYNKDKLNKYRVDFLHLQIIQRINISSNTLVYIKVKMQRCTASIHYLLAVTKNKPPPPPPSPKASPPLLQALPAAPTEPPPAQLEPPSTTQVTCDGFTLIIIIQQEHFSSFFVKSMAFLPLVQCM